MCRTVWFTVAARWFALIGAPLVLLCPKYKYKYKNDFRSPAQTAAYTARHATLMQERLAGVG